MKKLFILASLGFLLFGALAFASNDCSMVNIELQKYIAANENSESNTDKVLWFGEMYPYQAFNKALMNLKAYCCETNAYALKTPEICKPDEDYFVAYYPESDYLYDHLIDIALRRLDASSDVYGLEPDPLGLEWREYISKEVGDSNDPGFALAMEKKYKDYWSIETSEYTSYAGTWTNEMTTGEIFVLSKSYKDANLYQRYIETCGIAAQVYFVYSSDAIANSKASIKSAAYYYCKSIVNQRISDEILYTKAQMADKSSKLLHKSVEAYLTNYFAKNRLINLQETVLFISDLFVSVAKMVPEGTRECH